MAFDPNDYGTPVDEKSQGFNPADYGIGDAQPDPTQVSTPKHTLAQSAGEIVKGFNPSAALNLITQPAGLPSTYGEAIQTLKQNPLAPITNWNALTVGYNLLNSVLPKKDIPQPIPQKPLAYYQQVALKEFSQPNRYLEQLQSIDPVLAGQTVHEDLVNAGLIKPYDGSGMEYYKHLLEIATQFNQFNPTKTQLLKNYAITQLGVEQERLQDPETRLRLANERAAEQAAKVASAGLIPIPTNPDIANANLPLQNTTDVATQVGAFAVGAGILPNVVPAKVGQVGGTIGKRVVHIGGGLTKTVPSELAVQAGTRLGEHLASGAVGMDIFHLGMSVPEVATQMEQGVSAQDAINNALLSTVISPDKKQALWMRLLESPTAQGLAFGGIGAGSQELAITRGARGLNAYADSLAQNAYDMSPRFKETKDALFRQADDLRIRAATGEGISQGEMVGMSERLNTIWKQEAFSVLNNSQKLDITNALVNAEQEVAAGNKTQEQAQTELKQTLSKIIGEKPAPKPMQSLESLGYSAADQSGMDEIERTRVFQNQIPNPTEPAPETPPTAPTSPATALEQQVATEVAQATPSPVSGQGAGETPPSTAKQQGAPKSVTEGIKEGHISRVRGKEYRYTNGNWVNVDSGERVYSGSELWNELTKQRQVFQPKETVDISSPQKLRDAIFANKNLSGIDLTTSGLERPAIQAIFTEKRILDEAVRNKYTDGTTVKAYWDKAIDEDGFKNLERKGIKYRVTNPDGKHIVVDPKALEYVKYKLREKQGAPPSPVETKGKPPVPAPSGEAQGGATPKAEIKPEPSNPVDVKKQKADLLAQVDDALGSAKSQSEFPDFVKTKEKYEERVTGVATDNLNAANETLKKQVGVKVFDVKGDGEFTIINTKEHLQEFRDRVQARWDKAEKADTETTRQAMKLPKGATNEVEILDALVKQHNLNPTDTLNKIPLSKGGEFFNQITGITGDVSINEARRQLVKLLEEPTKPEKPTPTETPTPARTTALASGLPQKSVDKLDAAMKAKDANLLINYLTTSNKRLREIFTESTGVKLPKTEGGTRAAIRQWIADGGVPMEGAKGTVIAPQAEPITIARRQALQSGISPELFDKAVESGLKWAKEKGTDFTEWSKSVVSDVGDWVKQHLPALWEYIKGGFEGSLINRTLGNVKDLAIKAHDFVALGGIHGLERTGLADKAVEHASVQTAVPEITKSWLAQVFPDVYKDPVAMSKYIDIANKNNIAGGYDRIKALYDQAVVDGKTRTANDLKKKLDAIASKRDMELIDQELQVARQDPKMIEYGKNWNKVVVPELDALYREQNRHAPNTADRVRGRYPELGERINLLSKQNEESMRNMSDPTQHIPEGSSTSYRNPNVKRSLYDKRAKFTGDYSTDAQAVLSNALYSRMKQVTKLRLYDEAVNKGVAYWADSTEGTPDIQGKKAVPYVAKVPMVSKDGQVFQRDRTLMVRQDLVPEIRRVLDTDMRNAQHPASKVFTGLQLTLSLVDATAHLKNQHSVIANSLRGTAAWKEIVRKMPFLSSAEAFSKMGLVARESMLDTTQIRAEKAFLAKNGMLRPSFPTTGLMSKVQLFGKFLHESDTAGRIIMNRAFTELVKSGEAVDTMQNRRAFVNQIGEYNKRLMGNFERIARESGASPFIVAGRTFNRYSKRLLTGSYGFEAASHSSALRARAINWSTLAATIAIPALLNSLITGKAQGRAGTPIGAIDLGGEEKDGKHATLDVLQITGARRGLRATGLGALIEGVQQGKTANDIGGQAVSDIVSTAAHPWLGPALGATAQILTGKRLDLRGGAQPQEARNMGGGIKQYAENARVALKNQNPQLYSLASPLIGEGDKTFGQELAQGLMKSPASAVGYREVSTPALKMASDINRSKLPLAGSTDENRKTAQVKRDIFDGKITSEQAVKEGKITFVQARLIEHEKSLTKIQRAINGMDVETIKTKILPLATDEEKKQIEPILEKKEARLEQKQKKESSGEEELRLLHQQAVDNGNRLEATLLNRFLAPISRYRGQMTKIDQSTLPAARKAQLKQQYEQVIQRYLEMAKKQFHLETAATNP